METITLTVNTTVDENDGGEAGTGLSLREAIDIANQSPENNYVIELQGGATYTLTLDSGDPSDNHLDIEQGNVTIRSTGNERAIIDASGLENPDIVLHILGDANVSLKNLTFTGGVAEGNDEIEGLQSGGGLFISDRSTVTVTNSLITGNSAANGGGIFADRETTVTILDSEINNNQADVNGGGILSSSGNLTIRNSEINGNSVAGNNPDNSSNGKGGGIAIFAGKADIVETTVAENSSFSSGGGITIDTDREVNIYSSTIRNNASGSVGGGIEVITAFDFDPTIRIVDSTISGNTANSSGGGVYTASVFADFSQENILVQISNSTIANNIADFDGDDLGDGGGISTIEDDLIAVDNSIIAGNFDSGGDVASDVSGFGFSSLTIDVLTTKRIIGDGNNIIGTLDADGVEGSIGTGSDLLGVDPLLTSLEDNGEGRLIHKLQADSTAIDAGNNELVTADVVDLDGDGNTEERVPLNSAGDNRIVNDTVDIGAFEFGSTTNTPDNPDSNSNDNTVFRFFNNDTGVHFYTGNETERDAVLELDNFSFEGGSYRAVDPLTGNPELLPVYRFLNQDTGVHLYTISEVERDATQELSNFSFEGEAFFAYETEIEDSIPIYRFFNPSTGAHFYTPSEAERDNVEANLPEFQSEGIAYYALALE